MPIDYDQLAATYAATRSAHPAVMARLHDAVIAAQDARAGRLLEIGCGTGNYVGSLHAATGITARGIDPSAEMLAVARNRWPDVCFEQGAGEALPLADGSVDFAFSVDVAHHLADPPACFADAWRVLVPGGRLCTVTDSERIIATRAPLAIYWPETVAAELQRYHPIDTLEAWLGRAGFVHITAETVEHGYTVTGIEPYRARAFSALRLIDDDAFARGLARLEGDLAYGAVRCVARYVMLWAEKPDNSYRRRYVNPGSISS